MVLKIESAHESRDELIRLFKYQPFELPDGTVTSGSLAMHKSTSTRALRPNETEEWPEFYNAAMGHAQMHDDMLQQASDFIGGFDGLTFADFGCNAGYAVYRAMELGACEATGIDGYDFSRCFDILNRDKNRKAEFIQSKYSGDEHRFMGLPDNFTADVIYCSAFLCHMSEPLFTLRHLADMAQKALIVHTRIIPSSEYFVRFSHATNKYGSKGFPLCFDGATEISENLLMFGLKNLGLRKIKEIPHREYWCPRSPEWRAFVAMR